MRRRNGTSSETYERKTQSMTAVLAGVLIVFLLQLWLIHVALEAHLAADPHVAVPTFIASAVCFFINLGLLRYVNLIDSAKEG